MPWTPVVAELFLPVNASDTFSPACWIPSLIFSPVVFSAVIVCPVLEMSPEPVAILPLEDLIVSDGGAAIFFFFFA